MKISSFLKQVSQYWNFLRFGEMRVEFLLSSFLSYLFQAMVEIHKSSVGVHGNLKSSNCLIDSRWVVKVSNFGHESFLEKSTEAPKDPYIVSRSMFTLKLLLS